MMRRLRECVAAAFLWAVKRAGAKSVGADVMIRHPQKGPRWVEKTKLHPIGCKFPACVPLSISLVSFPMSVENSSKVERIASDPAFHDLLARKKSFIVRTTIFFMLYYFALLVLVGWAPDLMKKPVLGKLNLAYLFALSQFFMAWIVALIYVKKAAQWDADAAKILNQ
jgi:uncharacterized membrane protein (DUF485 family)